MRPFFVWWWAIGLVGLALFLAVPGRGFATGTLLSLTVDPATLRQNGDKALSKAVVTVLLKDPSPSVFVCIIRSDEPAKISFPTIVFREGDRKAACEGKVMWKAVRREQRIRITAYNADAPDGKITFTVTLIPAEESTAPGGP